MIKLLVFVDDLPDGKIHDDALVAPFHTVPDSIVLPGLGADPDNPYDIPEVQQFVLDDGVDIPTSLPAAIPEGARIQVVLEVPSVWPNFGFKAESDGYNVGNYQGMLIVAAMLGYI
jgi:hypothetical protein